MSDQEVLNILECSNEFATLSESESDTELFQDNERCGVNYALIQDSPKSSSSDSMPALAVPKRRPRQLSNTSDEDNTVSSSSPHSSPNHGETTYTHSESEGTHSSDNENNDIVEMMDNIQGDGDCQEHDRDDQEDDRDDQEDDRDDQEDDRDDQEDDRDDQEDIGDDRDDQEDEGDDMEDDRDDRDNDRDYMNDRDDDTDDESDIIDILQISRLFRKKLKRYGISQRKAAKFILKCSQSTLSETYAKAVRLGTSKELTPRGKELYLKMQEWMSSPSAQKETQRISAHQRAYGAKSSTPREKGKKAVKFSSVQMAVLVKLYKKDNRPSAQKLQLIAETLGLEILQIRTWFNNQRARNFPAGKESILQNHSIPDDLDNFVSNY